MSIDAYLQLLEENLVKFHLKPLQFDTTAP